MTELLQLSKDDHPDPMTTVWSDTEIRAIQEYARKCIAAERNRLLGLAVEPVAYIYHDADSIEELLHNERSGISVNSVLLGLKRRENGRNETALYTADQLAAARLQDQQRIAALESERERINKREPVAYLNQGIACGKVVANHLNHTEKEAKNTASVFSQHYPTVNTVPLFEGALWPDACADRQRIAELEAQIAARKLLTDERWGLVGAEVVQDIAAHGIKEGGAA